MDLRLLHPGHPLRLRTEISRVRKIAEGSHQVMRLVLWCDGSAIVISAVPTMMHCVSEGA